MPSATDWTQVVDIADGNKFKIHFVGWHSNCDEWVQSHQMAPCGAMVCTWHLPISKESTLHVHCNTPSILEKKTIDKHTFQLTWADQRDVITHMLKVRDIMWHEVVAYRAKREIFYNTVEVSRVSDSVLLLKYDNRVLFRVFE